MLSEATVGFTAQLHSPENQGQRAIPVGSFSAKARQSFTQLALAELGVRGGEGGVKLL
jgi:hypothetical protein